MRTVHIICGPTASGKSALAVDFAARNNGVIINADSMQIYDALPILTAQPSETDRTRVSHRLYASLRPDRKCSAQIWCDMAIAEIAHVFDAGRVPVVVGGTGLYLKALISGLSEIPDVSPAIRQKAIDRQKALGNPAFHADLAQRDPVMAARLNPNDTQRLVRAWEIFEGTGKSLAFWQGVGTKRPAADWTYRIQIKSPSRDDLHMRCDQRFDAMIRDGVLDEIRAFIDQARTGVFGSAIPVMNALGFHPLGLHLAGTITLEDAIFRAKADTRQYAKRQDTWFRHQIEPAACIEEIVRIP